LVITDGNLEVSVVINNEAVTDNGTNGDDNGVDNGEDNDEENGEENDIPVVVTIEPEEPQTEPEEELIIAAEELEVEPETPETGGLNYAIFQSLVCFLFQPD